MRARARAPSRSTSAFALSLSRSEVAGKTRERERERERERRRAFLFAEHSQASSGSDYLQDVCSESDLEEEERAARSSDPATPSSDPGTPKSEQVTPRLVSSEPAAGAAARAAQAVPLKKGPKKPASVSPEQPERVTAVFKALQKCAWACGGVRLVEALELTTSPTLASALDEGVAGWARVPAPRDEAASRPRGPPRRTSSVSYLFDDLEPIVLRVHDPEYLSRIAVETEKMRFDTRVAARPAFAAFAQAAQVGQSSSSSSGSEADAGLVLLAAKKKRQRFALSRCVSVTMTGDTFASARSLHAALCASFAACRAVDAVVRGEYRNAFAAIRPPGHHAGSSGSTTADESTAPGEESKLVGQGFCLINHVAVAARYALTNHSANVKKVAVIDWDLHHGNGTEQILCASDGPMATRRRWASPRWSVWSGLRQCRARTY